MAIGELAAPLDDRANGLDQAIVSPAVLASVVVMAEPSWWRASATACFAENGIRVHLDPAADCAFVDGWLADAAIVHLDLVGRPATEVFDAWRGRSNRPLLAIAANDADETTIVAAYAAGADYVASTDTSPRQLIARLRSLLRRSGLARPAPFAAPTSVSPIAIDRLAGVAVVDGTKVVLTEPELDFLQLLIDRNGRVVSRAEVREALAAADRAVDFFVRRVRDKLESVDGQRRIVAVRGVGFRFDGAPAVPPVFMAGS